MVEPEPANHVTKRGAYGIRTRAAAVRGRCPRPLDECARRRPSVATAEPRELGRWPKRSKKHCAEVRLPVGAGANRRPEPGFARREAPCARDVCTPAKKGGSQSPGETAKRSKGGAHGGASGSPMPRLRG